MKSCDRCDSEGQRYVAYFTFPDDKMRRYIIWRCDDCATRISDSWMLRPPKSKFV